MTDVAAGSDRTVLDAGAIIAYLRGEDGADAIRAAIVDPDRSCCMHVLNLAEVFYDFHRVGGEPEARRAVDDLRQLGIRFRDDIDPGFWQEAARLKSVHRRISLADWLGSRLPPASAQTF